MIRDDKSMGIDYLFNTVMNQLIRGGSINARKAAMKHGAGGNQFGVGITRIKELAKRLGKNHELGIELWKTKNSDAMILGTFLMREEKLSKDDLEEMIQNVNYFRLMDEFISRIVVRSIYAEELALSWKDSEEGLIGRAGWNIIFLRLLHYKHLFLAADQLLEQIDRTIQTAPVLKQEMMQYCRNELKVNFQKEFSRYSFTGIENG